MPKFSYTEWQAAQARLTVFPTLDSSTREPEWWQQVTGKEPTHHTEDRKRHSSAISGELETGTLTLALAPERIDWILSASDADPALTFSAVGPMIDAFHQFSMLAEGWLSADNIPSISRVAFGAVITHLETDSRAAYGRLPDYVPVRLDPTWRDVIFQINAPRDLAPQNDYGLKYLNRLSRWSVQLYTTGKLVPGLQGFVSGTNTNKYALRLEMDVNTPVEFLDTIPHTELVALFHELVEAGSGIARDGVSHEQYRL